MSSWGSLTKKEFQIGFPVFLIAIFTFAVLFVGGYFLGDYVGVVDEMLIVSSLMALAAHFFFIAIYLLYSLTVERKRLHLWLHNPLPVSGLLSAKLFSGVIYFVITLAITVTLAAFFIDKVPEVAGQLQMGSLIGLMFSTTTVYCLFLGATALLFWAIFQILSQQLNDFVSFILTFFLFLLVDWLGDFISDLSIIGMLFDWGPVQLGDLLLGLELHFETETTEGQFGTTTDLIYIGHFVKDLIVATILFFASSWLIDRKVEV